MMRNYWIIIATLLFSFSATATTYRTDSFGTARDDKGNSWRTDSFGTPRGSNGSVSRTERREYNLPYRFIWYHSRKRWDGITH